MLNELFDDHYGKVPVDPGKPPIQGSYTDVIISTHNSIIKRALPPGTAVVTWVKPLDTSL